MPTKPVIFLAFANEKRSEARYLRALAREQALLKEALEPAIVAGLCEVVVESNATVNSIIDTFQKARYQNRIAVFHYGGHADGYQLLLEDLEGGNAIAHGGGLVSFLSKQSTLRLVFLNGCSTQRQAEELVQAGVPAVIGTSKSISDEVATQLAARFYQSIGQGATLDRAWREAEDEVKIRCGDSPKRDVLFTFTDDDQTQIADHFPWNIHYRQGAGIVASWNLPQTVGNPLFGLPDLPRDFDLPESPYRFLRRFERRHAEVFFGRGTYIRDVYMRSVDPHAAPVLLLYGQSGVGKSSLLHGGVLPRLEQTCNALYLRRDPEMGLTQTLMGAFEQKVGNDADSLKNAWLEKEEKSKKRVVLILDQVEEAFTRPLEEEQQELLHFMQLVQGIFDHPKDRPIGKLVLSYRKEFHPEIEEQCRQLAIPREKIFIDKLNRADIIEVVNGLTSNERLQRRYQLTVEETLPGVIADDLLVDPNSAIAPVLQILLTKMWDLTETDGGRQFTVAKYNELRKAGILLDDFYAEQMAQLHDWNAEVVDSGLALDLLNLHTTHMGTADSRDLEEIRTLYQHRQDLLDQLLTRLKSLYLLTEVGSKTTGLTHDALAPIVQREIKDSDKPGQRALRILSSKMPEYQYSPETVYIDEEDLMLVERGAGGMRLWTLKEQQLIEKSRKRRAKLQAERKRNQRLKNIGAVAITALAILAGIFAFRSNQQAKREALKAEASKLVSEALREEKVDATKAVTLLDSALTMLPNEENTLQVRHEVYSNNEFYQQHFNVKEPIIATALSPDGNGVLAVGESSGNVHILQKNNSASGDGKMITHAGPIIGASYSPDGQQMITFGNDSIVRIWDRNGQLIRLLEGHHSPVRSTAFQPGTDHLMTGGLDGELIVWNKTNNQMLRRWTAHQERVSDISFAPSGDTLATISRDLSLALWTAQGQLLWRVSLAALPYSVAYDPLGQYILAGTRDGKLTFYSMSGKPIFSIQAHRQSINKVACTPDGQLILTAGDDRQIKGWNRKGELLKTYRGHREEVRGLAIVGDGQYFVSASMDSTVKYWPTQSKIIQKYLHKGKVISSLDCAQGGRFIAGIGSLKMEIDIRDPTISDETINQLYDAPAAQSAFIWKEAGQQLFELKGHSSYLTSVAFSPDGAFCLTGGGDKQVIYWSEEGKKIQAFQGMTEGVKAVAFSPDGQLIAACGLDSSALVWNLKGEQQFRLLYPDVVEDLCFSRDGTQLLTAGYDGLVRRWSVSTQQIVDTFRVAGGRVVSIAVSPDGQYFAAGSGAGEAGVYVWTREGTPHFQKKIISQNEMGGQAVNDLAFHDNGQLIAAATEGGIVKVFDLSGQELQTMDDTAGADANCVVFSKDGTSLLVGSGDGWIRRYQLK